MPRTAVTVTVSIAACVTAAAGAAGAWLYAHRDPFAQPAAAERLLQNYCFDCHNSIDRAGGMSLEGKDYAHVGRNAKTWEHVVRKLQAGMMPPPDGPRPPRKTLDELTADLKTRLDHAERTHPAPRARTALRRLNRTEYANAIRDLLHLDVDTATLLPLDDSSDGFDDVAAALGTSPSLIQGYISAAMKISRRALGDPTAPRSQVTYTAPATLVQDRHLEGLPLGTRGGLRIEHDFPLDADYEIHVRAGYRMPAGTRLDVTLDGAPVKAANAASFRIPVSAGPHVLTAALVDAWRPAGVDGVYGHYETQGSVQRIEIDGPFDATGVGDTPSRRRILICTPETSSAARPCARKIVSKLAMRAFRRPVSQKGLAALMGFYDTGAEHGGFEAGIEQALSRILVDPRFLYRIEPAPAGIAPGTVYRVDD
jgi:mono/diheme cytochrome c family protein